MVSVIVPALNEEAVIADTLRSIHASPGAKEILVADGGSADATAHIARSSGARVVIAPRGRGQQMRAAGAEARGHILWFVHADTRVPASAISDIEQACRQPGVSGGNFALRFSGNSRAVYWQNVIAKYTRFTGICYGDSGIFVTRAAYDAIGGIRPLSLFEDVDLVRRIRRAGTFVSLSPEVVASSRRFEDGWLRVWALWITLQVLYWMGVSPETLARWYRQVR